MPTATPTDPAQSPAQSWTGEMKKAAGSVLSKILIASETKRKRWYDQGKEISDSQAQQIFWETTSIIRSLNMTRTPTPGAVLTKPLSGAAP